MYCCYYDPGMALFLSDCDDEPANPLDWVALSAAVLLTCVTLALMR